MALRVQCRHALRLAFLFDIDRIGNAVAGKRGRFVCVTLIHVCMADFLGQRLGDEWRIGSEADILFGDRGLTVRDGVRYRPVEPASGAGGRCCPLCAATPALMDTWQMPLRTVACASPLLFGPEYG